MEVDLIRTYTLLVLPRYLACLRYLTLPDIKDLVFVRLIIKEICHVLRILLQEHT